MPDGNALSLGMVARYDKLMYKHAQLLTKMNNRATPEAILYYKLAIQLYKLYNSNVHTYDWVLLNTNQIFTSRQTTFMAFKSNTSKVGLNLLVNRLSILNGKIPLIWLNETMTSFKLKCKRSFLNN